MDAAPQPVPQSGASADPRRSAACALAAALLCAAAPAAAQNSGWEHGFATYLMATGMTGEVGLGPLEGDLDVGFSDLLDHLELGLMMAYVTEREPWTIGVDAIFMNLEATKSVGGLSFQGEADQSLVSVDGAYRLSERLEVLGGLRFNDIDANLAAVDLAGSTRSADMSESWVDPYIGARYTLPFADNWSFTLRGDVGGFGVGADSAWQLVARFNLTLGDQLAVLFGYRVIDVDYEDGAGAERFLFDVQSSGPVIGVGWRY